MSILNSETSFKKKLKAIDIKSQSLILKSSYFKFREDFVILNLEANFNIKFRSKQFLI